MKIKRIFTVMLALMLTSLVLSVCALAEEIEVNTVEAFEKAMREIGVPKRFTLGEQITKGLGAGATPEVICSSPMTRGKHGLNAEYFYSMMKIQKTLCVRHLSNSQTADSGLFISENQNRG